MESPHLARETAAATARPHAELARFMRIHGPQPEPSRLARRFSAKLALQRAFVAAPTD